MTEQEKVGQAITAEDKLADKKRRLYESQVLHRLKRMADKTRCLYSGCKEPREVRTDKPGCYGYCKAHRVYMNDKQRVNYAKRKSLKQ